MDQQHHWAACAPGAPEASVRGGRAGSANLRLGFIRGELDQNEFATAADAGNG